MELMEIMQFLFKNNNQFSCYLYPPRTLFFTLFLPFVKKLLKRIGFNLAQCPPESLPLISCIILISKCIFP